MNRRVAGEVATISDLAPIIVPIAVDIRVVAATNRNLEQEVAAGRFRADLYYRLNVLSVKTAPLRERPQDIPLLARHFLQESAARARRMVEDISREAETILKAYHWPGNVRQLQNAMEYAGAVSAGETILPEDLPPEVLEPSRFPASFDQAVEGFKRRFLKDAVAAANGNYAEAAARAGAHPKTVRRLLRRS